MKQLLREVNVVKTSFNKCEGMSSDIYTLDIILECVYYFQFLIGWARSDLASLPLGFPDACYFGLWMMVSLSIPH